MIYRYYPLLFHSPLSFNIYIFLMIKTAPPPLPPLLSHWNLFLTQKSTVWWINIVFWSHHLKAHGNVYALLILDNCIAHKYLYDRDVVRKFGLPDKLWIVFLPPNCTSNIQPAGMDVIEVLWVGYKLFMVRRLLDVYEDHNFTDIDTSRKRQKIGCKVWRLEVKLMYLIHLKS